jgi:hypothetical protein
MIFKAPAVRAKGAGEGGGARSAGASRGPTRGGGGAAGGQGATSEADNGKVEESLKRPLSLYTVSILGHSLLRMSGPKIEEDTFHMRRRIYVI